jgi:hypothetical protein
MRRHAVYLVKFQFGLEEIFSDLANDGGELA